jgi:hypothetical protein
MADFPTDGLETLYPIQPVTKTNSVVFRLGNMAWGSTQKSASEWHHELWTGRFRIQKAYMSEMLTFLSDYHATPITLNLPGVQPFIRAAESNSVYIVQHNDPRREDDRPMHYVFSVTFLRVPD